MAERPSPIFRPRTGRRGAWFHQQPLRASALQPQQGFLDDPTTVAVYQMEEGFLTSDSVGNNTLTNNLSVTSSDVNPREASFTASFTGGAYFSLTDANQSSDFPLKSGQSNTVWSITAWVKLTNASNTQVIWGKGDSVNRSVQFGILSSGNLGFRVHNGVTFDDTDFGVGLSDNVWYHFGFEFDDDNLSYRLVLYNNSTASETIVQASGTTHAPQNTGVWGIGAFGNGTDPIDGFIDEFSITGRILGVPDIREIRQGIYDGPLSNRVTQFGVQTLVVSSQKPVRTTQFGVQVLIQEPTGTARVTQLGVQVLYLPKPIAVKQFPVIPAQRVLQTQPGKRIFPL